MAAENPEKIPFDVIRLLVQIFLKHYSYPDIDRLFPHISNIELNVCHCFNEEEEDELYRWFYQVNQQDHPQPLDVLGELLNDFWYLEELHNVEFGKYQDDKNKIQTRLSRSGLSYSETDSRIIKIKKSEAPSTCTLRDHVEQHKLINLDSLIQQSLDNIENNPLSAVLHACSTLESVLKEYLATRQIPYNKNSDTLSKLWNIFMENNQKIRPKELKDNDLKEIAAGLNSIIKGTMSLRNKKSSAHGRSEEESRTIEISPRHARLAIHAVHTLSAYILELGEHQKKRDS
ncbi:MAG: abortive infection family protein [Acetobacter sp.]|nr:abortive infection family protein [Acetobacter sp.]